MEVITIDSFAFKKIIEKLDAIHFKPSLDVPSNPIGWLNNEELCKALCLSKRTLQNYRDQKVLPYSIIRGRVFYKIEDVRKVLHDNLVVTPKQVVRS